MLYSWDLGCPRSSKSEKCSRPDRQMDDSDSWFPHLRRMYLIMLVLNYIMIRFYCCCFDI